MVVNRGCRGGWKAQRSNLLLPTGCTTQPGCWGSCAPDGSWWGGKERNWLLLLGRLLRVVLVAADEPWERGQWKKERREERERVAAGREVWVSSPFIIIIIIIIFIIIVIPLCLFIYFLNSLSLKCPTKKAHLCVLISSNK